jgi:hypothetical protein
MEIFIRTCVHVTIIQNTIPCEACFIHDQDTAEKVLDHLYPAAVATGRMLFSAVYLMIVQIEHATCGMDITSWLDFRFF